MKFGKTKGTECLLKLTKFGVAKLIFGVIPLASCEATETRPAGDVLCFYLSLRYWDACIHRGDSGVIHKGLLRDDDDNKSTLPLMTLSSQLCYIKTGRILSEMYISIKQIKYSV